MKLKDRQRLTGIEIAQLLRGLAAGFEEGTLHLGEAEVPVPEVVEAELDYEEKEGKSELEIEIKWR